jgi:hypothetical protein
MNPPVTNIQILNSENWFIISYHILMNSVQPYEPLEKNSV